MKRSLIFTLAAASALTGFTATALGQESGMKGMDMKGMSCCEDMAHGFGVVNSVNMEARKVNLTHDPIEKIGWGEMTMDFTVGDMVALEKFEKGDNVHFMLKKGDGNTYSIWMMCPVGGDPAAFKEAMKSMMSGRHMMGKEGGMQHMDHDDDGGSQ